MNLIEKNWLKTKNIELTTTKGKIKITNNSQHHGFLILPKVYKADNQEKRIVFEGKNIKGVAPTLKIINRKKVVKAEFNFNTKNILKLEQMKYYFIVIYVLGNSCSEIEKIIYDNDIEELNEMIENHFKHDTLVITPGYPSDSNKYNTAFVHTRVKEYFKNDMPVDVLVINSLKGKNLYRFDGIEVLKGDYGFLRDILKTKHYKRIMIHFFDEFFGNVLDSVDITSTHIYLYSHGADILYRDLPQFASKYFEKDLDISVREEEFLVKDYYMRKYSNLKNVKWIFVSDFVRKRAEEILKIKFNNYEIIPCYIDENLFNFQKKDPELRKKVFVLRKFSNDRCYAIDIDVRVILELSRRECFKDMEFDIYGSGEMFEKLTAPLLAFKNVNLHQTFLTHEEIKKVHDEHGIALFATRYDTQGVSLGEAASSGCAIITSNIETITNYIDSKLGITCDIENYVEYADAIEKIYTDPSYFEKICKSVSTSVRDKFGYEQTIAKELKIFKNEKEIGLEVKNQNASPLLTIVVPSYNVEKYLWNGIITLLNQPYNDKLEILIVNDGSTDSTAKIAEKLTKLTNDKKEKIIRVINKENGGHGSTINKGISIAKGKYLKIMDADDTVDSIEFSKLIKILESEDSDIILNNYIEDYAYDNVLNFKNIYNFMIPGVKYNFEDLCYEGYGFNEWGPILSCSTYKTELLRKANFKLSEKTFYVDMELNENISLACETITYYPLNVYRYLLGRSNQSVAKSSYMRNYKHHEKVTINLIKTLYKNQEKISNIRREYIVKKIILPMIKTQYVVTIEFYNKGKPFREFEKELKKYPEFYSHPIVKTRAIKFHRATKGILIRFNSLLVRIKNIVRRFI